MSRGSARAAVAAAPRPSSGARRRSRPTVELRKVNRATARPSIPAPAGSSSRPGRRSRTRARRLPFPIGVFLLVACLVLAVVVLQAVLSQGSFRMRELDRQTLQLRQEYERLKLEVAELTAPGRLIAAARGLGLRLPDPDEIQVLTVDVPVPGVAPPDDSVTFAMKPVVRGRP